MTIAASACEDCGIPVDRHGSDCGYDVTQAYGNPEWGRPGGWVDGSGRRVPDPTVLPAPACLRDGGRLVLTAAYDIEVGDGKDFRAYVYRCDACSTEHVYGCGQLAQLEPADEDDTDFRGTPVSIDGLADPLR